MYLCSNVARVVGEVEAIFLAGCGVRCESQLGQCVRFLSKMYYPLSAPHHPGPSCLKAN